MFDYRMCRPSFEVKKEEMCFKKNSYMRNAHYNKERQGWFIYFAYFNCYKGKQFC